MEKRKIREGFECLMDVGDDRSNVLVSERNGGKYDVLMLINHS
jgi:hypothetical protein